MAEKKDYDLLKQQEMQMFKEWKEQPTPNNFQKLYTSFKPLIFEASKKFSIGSTIPRTAHRAYAAQNFYNALNTYDPKHGAQLKSWVTTWISEKGKRMNYIYGNLGSIPEPRITKITSFKSVQQLLRDKLGREPSTVELADELGWSQKDVGLLTRELRKDILEDEKSEMFAFKFPEKTQQFVEYLQYDLTPEELNVYEYIYGLNGKPNLRRSNGEPDIGKIASKLRVSEAKIRQIKTKIANRIRDYQKRGLV